MKIALVLCPGWGRDVPPYTLALLTACLRKAGNEVFPFDINNALFHLSKEGLQWEWEESDFWQNQENVTRYVAENKKIIAGCIMQILAQKPEIIGFSVYSSNRIMSLEMARMIKKEDRGKVIVFGGAECTRRNLSDALINQDSVDTVVVGEAEETFPELARIIDKEGNLEPCEGIIYKKDGRVIDCGDRIPVKDLDSLPFADFTDFDFNSYKLTGNCFLMCSRGCTERCAYCSARNVYKGFRSMSGERIFLEIEHQVGLEKRTGISRYFMFTDSLLNGNVKELVRFCDLMIENRRRIEKALYSESNQGHVYWLCQTIIRPEMNFETLKKMKDAGCTDVTYGVESGSERMYKVMGKRFSPEIAERVIKDTNRAGILVSVNFMFGFPGETEEDFGKTLKFMERNAKYMNRIYPSRTFCALEKFSYLEAHREEFGISPQKLDHYLYWESRDGRNNYLERLRRYEEFCNLAESLNPISLDTGVADSVREKHLSIARHHQFRENYSEALRYYQEYLNSTGSLSSVKEDIEFCKRSAKCCAETLN